MRNDRGTPGHDPEEKWDEPDHWRLLACTGFAKIDSLIKHKESYQIYV
jgi:hypothetical protein